MPIRVFPYNLKRLNFSVRSISKQLYGEAWTFAGYMLRSLFICWRNSEINGEISLFLIISLPLPFSFVFVLCCVLKCFVGFCCVVFRCVALCCIVQFCAVLCRVVPCYVVFYSFVLCCVLPSPVT